jgi:chorismate mutase
MAMATKKSIEDSQLEEWQLTKLEKIMKDQDVKKATKIKIAETIIFPTLTYRSESWTVRKK